MAGSTNVEGGSDNPVDTNVVPMIDVIFCLCLFFMCSFHFKALEGKIESWMPKNKGEGKDIPPDIELAEIRIVMAWDTGTGQTHIRVNSRHVTSDNELKGVLLANVEDYKKLGNTDVPAIIDSEPQVPWQNVVSVMDICKDIKIEKIEFAGPKVASAESPR